MFYRSKYGLLPGTSYEDVAKVARREFNAIRRRTRRQPYVRSEYFSKDKIFLTLFWDHLAQKRRGDRTHRLRLYAAALDTLRHSRIEPETILSSADPGIILYRFYGITKNGHIKLKRNNP